MSDMNVMWINDTEQGQHDLDIARFVLEGDDFANHLVSRASDELAHVTDRRHITFASAVTAGDQDSLCAAVEAIYLHLKQDYHLRYEFESAFNATTREQRVRLPGIIRRENRGTCLDLALLFASCLANAKLWPIVVVVNGHALTACWVEPPDPVRKTFIGLDEFRGHIGSGRIVAVECTGFVEGFPERQHKLSYVDACQTAQDVLHQLIPGQFRFALDINRAWEEKKIQPMPSPEPSGAPAALVEYLYVDRSRLQSYSEQLLPAGSVRQPVTVHESVVRLLAHLKSHGLSISSRPFDPFEDDQLDQPLFRMEAMWARRAFIPSLTVGQMKPEGSSLRLWVSLHPEVQHESNRGDVVGPLFLIEDFQGDPNNQFLASGYSSLLLLAKNLRRDHPSSTLGKQLAVFEHEEKESQSRFARDPIGTLTALGAQFGAER